MKKRYLLFYCLFWRLSAAQAQKITGAGATFPYPIYSKWFTEYSAAHPGVQINYQSIGSGGGIKQVCSGTVDFGASDMPMTDELLASCGVKLVHIPTVLGAVVPVFNVPGVNDLRFSPDVLADIFLAKITMWNDPRIAKDNPGVHLPDQKIIVVHRSDGSGTTFIWTDYLSKVSTDWANGPGKGTSINWPTGVGGKGNEGVAGYVRQLPGAIGYVELIYALQNHINFGCDQERRRQLGQGLDRRRHGRRGHRQENARRLPRLHHQCSRPQRLSRLQLHLPAHSHASERYGEGKGHQGHAELDASSRAKAKSRLSPTLRFRRSLPPRSFRPSTRCRKAQRGVRRPPGSSLLRFAALPLRS